jgi:hypothetical protein
LVVLAQGVNTNAFSFLIFDMPKSTLLTNIPTNFLTVQGCGSIIFLLNTLSLIIFLVTRETAGTMSIFFVVGFA